MSVERDDVSSRDRMRMSMEGGSSLFGYRHEVVYGTAGNALAPLPNPQMLDLLCPANPGDDPAPAIVFVHGGGWSGGTRIKALVPWLGPLVAAHGFMAATIDYRLSPRSTFPAQIHDLKAAVRWLRANAAEIGVDPERIGVWGNSAGGHLAGLAGVTGDLPELEGTSGSPGYSTRLQAVTMQASPTDLLLNGGILHNDRESILTDFIGGTLDTHEAALRLASPITHISPDCPPFLIVHGTDDELIPFEHALRFTHGLEAAGVDVTLLPLEGAGHNLIVPRPDADPTEQFESLGQEMLGFFQRTLTPERACSVRNPDQTADTAVPRGQAQ